MDTMHIVAWCLLPFALVLLGFRIKARIKRTKDKNDKDDTTKK